MKKRKLQSVTFHSKMQVFEIVDPWMQESTNECCHSNPELEHEQEKARLWYSASDLNRMKQEAVKHALCIRNDDIIQETLNDDQLTPLTYSNILSSAFQWCCDTADVKHEFPLQQNPTCHILANALISHSYRDARGLEFQSVVKVRTERALRRYAVRTSVVRLQQYQQELRRNSYTVPQKKNPVEFAEKFRQISEGGSLVAKRWAQLMAWSDALEVSSETRTIPINSKIRTCCSELPLNSNPHVEFENKEKKTLIPTSSLNILPTTMTLAS
jgi:hypothetical protein